MNSDYDLSSLQIVGYSDRLNAGTVPSVVAPVFQVVEEPDVVLFAPYTVTGGRVIDAVLSTFNEFEQLEAKGEVTKFSNPFPAQADHELWIDRDLNPRYEPMFQVEAELGRIAVNMAGEAADRLRAGELSEAERCCRAAISANSRLADTYAIMGAIGRKRDSEPEFKLSRDMARGVITERSFDELVAKFLEAIPDAAPAAADAQAPPAALDLFGNKSRIIWGIAALRPSLALAKV
jgi:hypothetical protein